MSKTRSSSEHHDQRGSDGLNNAISIGCSRLPAILQGAFLFGLGAVGRESSVAEERVMGWIKHYSSLGMATSAKRGKESGRSDADDSDW
jgi:hypothetical protein